MHKCKINVKFYFKNCFKNLFGLQEREAIKVFNNFVKCYFGGNKWSSKIMARSSKRHFKCVVEQKYWWKKNISLSQNKISFLNLTLNLFLLWKNETNRVSCFIIRGGRHYNPIQNTMWFTEYFLKKWSWTSISLKKIIKI